MAYSRESDFEDGLIKILSEKCWEKAVLKNYSEQQLIDCLDGRDDKKAFACYEELEEISKDSNESKKD